MQASSTNFVRNCWYVAAWDHDILPDSLFERRILNESILFFRTADGAVTALSNRCCHRHAPLSMGRREGDCVRCMYHGLKFDATVTESLYQSVVAAFEEDRCIIQAQQAMLDDATAEPMLGLPVDAALGAYRQIYSRLLAAEANTG